MRLSVTESPPMDAACEPIPRWLDDAKLCFEWGEVADDGVGVGAEAEDDQEVTMLVLAEA